VSPLRAAIIGCGNIGSVYSDIVAVPGVYSHAHAYSAHAGVDLVAVSDPDQQKAQACADRWRVPGVFADHNEMLEQSKPEIVSICSPNETHVAIGLDVIQRTSVRGIFCEKPLAVDLDGARQLNEAATKHGKPLLVNYSRRFDEAYQELRSRLRDGALGRVQAITGLYGKGLFHNGTHWLDLVRFLFGEPRWVQGYRSGSAFGEDETYALTLGLDDGLSASLQGADHTALTVFEMDIIGTAGRAHLTNGGRTINYYDVVDSGFVPDTLVFDTTPRTSVAALANALPSAIANMVAGLEGSAALQCTGADGLAAVRLAEAVRASAQSSERVTLA